MEKLKKLIERLLTWIFPVEKGFLKNEGKFDFSENDLDNVELNLALLKTDERILSRLKGGD